jgi:hypothetical protein
MLKRFLIRTLRKALARPLYRRFARFEQACQHPEKTQTELLQAILAKHRNTAFAQDHHFNEIHNVADYRRHVPVAPYEYFDPYIRRVMQGEVDALLGDSKVLMFALTSGTTASRKHIPITQQYLDDYKRSWNLWGLRAIKKHKHIFFQPIVQMVGDADEYRSPSGVPCGNLSGFTAQVQKRIMRRFYVVPPCTGKVKNSQARVYIALRIGLRKPLGMLMAANPSTLVNLARQMDQFKENLIRDIANGTLNANLDIPPDIRKAVSAKLKPQRERAKQLEAFVNQTGHLFPKEAWPAEKLLIGCWTGGSVGPYLRQLSQYYGDAPIRDLGLVASEGRMSIPVEDHTSSGVLDITSHYFEFIPEGEIDSPQPTVLGAHELQQGRNYYILPTTWAGLYRYHICDLIRVTGFFHNTPLIEFVGKGNRYASLTGEKLSEHQVTRAMDQIATQIPLPLTAYSLAPVWNNGSPYYGLFIEQQDARDPHLLRQLVQALDEALHQSNIEYEAKRSSGRLGPIQPVLVPQGFWHQWDLEQLARRGGSPEQYKHPCLIGDVNFAEPFVSQSPSTKAA